MGIDAVALEDAGRSVWLFGSHAAGCAVATSDWDILVLGGDCATTRQQLGEFDVVTHSGDLRTWQTMDLASHVGTYGIRIAGHADAPSVAPRLAAARKRQVVRERGALLLRVWALFSPAKRAAEAARVRRDAQRSWLLSHDEAVPPRAVLDEVWQRLVRADRLSLVTAAELSGPVAKLMTAG